MSDIVERLRGAPPTNSTLDRYEAADTIEALRAENAELKKAINGVLWAFENVTMNENSKQLFALRAACAALGYE